MPVIISGSTGISGTDGSASSPAVQGTDTNTGMFFPAADTIAFSEGGTEVLRLNSSGNAVFTGTVRVGGISADLYPLVQDTAKNSTSGTFVDFTGIPSWAKRITIALNAVSTNGSSLLLVQAGSGSYEITGYASTGSYITTGSVSTGAAAVTTGYVVGNSNASTFSNSGILTMVNVSGNIWAFSGFLGATGATSIGNGIKTFSGVIDRVRLTTVNGTDLFDAGSVNVMWEG